jgi:hypothetical protein
MFMKRECLITVFAFVFIFREMITFMTQKGTSLRELLFTLITLAQTFPSFRTPMLNESIITHEYSVTLATSEWVSTFPIFSKNHISGNGAAFCIG